MVGDWFFLVRIVQSLSSEFLASNGVSSFKMSCSIFNSCCSKFWHNFLSASGNDLVDGWHSRANTLPVWSLFAIKETLRLRVANSISKVRIGGTLAIWPACGLPFRAESDCGWVTTVVGRFCEASSEVPCAVAELSSWLLECLFLLQFII